MNAVSRNLVLTGFMGTGKSTVGRRVADLLGMELVDTDAEIERQDGRSISDIFAEDGEAAFRERERTAVRAALRGGGRVVALGGGALLDIETRTLVERTSVVLTLTCDADEIAGRIGSSVDRPLLRHQAMGNEDRQTAGSLEGRIRTLLEQRAAVYGRYPQVDTTDLCPTEVAERVVSLYRACLGGGPIEAVGELRMDMTRQTRIVMGKLADVLEGMVTNPRHEDGSSRTGDGEDVRAPHAVIVTDHIVGGLYGREVHVALAYGGRRTLDITIAPGEAAKSLATVEHIYEMCYRAGVERSAIVVGLGGGVICDIAGFVAATYLRGLRFVALPTTLLAQVDAAIGGKVGVDFGDAKNMVGAFHPAELVALDPRALRTLPRALLSEGLAEMVKIAFALDAELLAALETLRKPEEVVERPDLIRRAAQAKVAVVARDPYEQGARALLNFGHTTGHAIEAASGFTWRHGAAVAAGMVVATRLAVDLGLCEKVLLARLVALLERFDLPTAVPDIPPRQSLDLMRHDKKREGGRLRFVLPRAPGEAVLRAVAPDAVLRALAATSEHGSTEHAEACSRP